MGSSSASDRNKTIQTKLLERFRLFPPAAAVGAFASFFASAFRARAASPPHTQKSGEPKFAQQRIQPTPSPAQFEVEYAQSSVLEGKPLAHPFRRSLTGIAIGAEDRVFAMGDGEVRVFQSNGDMIRSWKVPETAACLTVGPDGRVYIGAPGRVEIYSAEGNHAGGFAAGETGRPATVTAIKLFRKEILAADAAARLIRRYDPSGRQLGEIGTQNKTRSFILPNRSLDIGVDPQGVIHATDSGRHRVTSWSIDGSPLGYFGKFGHHSPEDFVGCCNPVNLAITPDGKVVTAEKVIARVKVYEPDGKLLALIGPEHFDPNCTHLHLAADSKGRILAADPVRLEVKIFSRVVRVGVNEPFCRETASSCVAADTSRNYEPLAKLAREVAGMELRFSYYKLEDQLVSAVERGEVDGMIAKAWTVLRAYRAAGIGCDRLCDVPFPDGDPYLTGVFISSSDGPVRSIKDLAGKRLAVGRPESYENSHSADRALRKHGVQPKTKQEYGGCIPASVSVLEGETDAAVVSSYCTRYGLDAIVGKPGAFRILGTTAPIPFVTFALSAQLPEGLRLKLKECLLDDSQPETARLFPGGLRAPIDWHPEELSYE